MKNLTFLTALLTLVAVLFYVGYRGLQFYHELIQPPVPAAGATAGPAQPGKLVTTISLTVIREVVPPSTAPAVPHALPRRQ